MSANGMSITPFLVIGFVGLLELLGFADFELKEHYKPNELDKLWPQANASVKSFSLSILRFQVEI